MDMTLAKPVAPTQVIAANDSGKSQPSVLDEISERILVSVESRTATRVCAAILGVAAVYVLGAIVALIAGAR